MFQAVCVNCAYLAVIVEIGYFLFFWLQTKCIYLFNRTVFHGSYHCCWNIMWPIASVFLTRNNLLSHVFFVWICWNCLPFQLHTEKGQLCLCMRVPHTCASMIFYLMCGTHASKAWSGLKFCILWIWSYFSNS